MKQERLVEIIRLEISDLDKDYNLNVPYTSKEGLRKLKLEDETKYKKAITSNKKYNSLKIRIRESEIIRIVEELSDSKKDKSKYPFIKDLIWLKVGNKYETYRKLADRSSKDKGVITFNGVRYKNLICSSSNVRCKKVLFIQEGLFDKVNKVLLCGIPENQLYPIFAKYNSYYGLPSTDSIPVSMPNIVVIDDPKNKITEIFDIVTGDLSENKYEIKNDQEHSIDIEFADGAGLVDVSRMQQWVKDLNEWLKLNKSNYKIGYLPASVQFRAIPGIKGNLYTFDLQAFAQNLKAENKPTTITDYWGKEWDFEKDNIDCIMTVSQFKFAKIYAELAEKNGDKTEGFNIWLNEFRKECEEYQRTFNLSEISEPYNALKRTSMLSYQPLQTLQFEDLEIEKLCAPMINKFKSVNTSIDAFINYRRIVEDDDGVINNTIPPFYQALKNNHTLYNDPYIKKKITDDLKSLRYKCYAGKVIIDGNYQVLTPDIYALAQATFGQEPTGLLGKNEVYSNYWNNQFYPFYTENKKRWYIKGTEEIDLIRNPHIAIEHCIARVIRDEAMDYWFKYQDTGIIFNIYDSFALRLNSADFDGDHILSTSSPIIIAAAKRANIKTIIDDVDRTKGDEEDEKKKSPLTPINNISKIINTNADGMKNSIGTVINKISILWSLSNNQTEKIQNAIKIMSVIGSLTIDFAKTGEVAKIPKNINQILNGVKKPDWMKYLKTAEINGEKKIDSNIEVYSLDIKDNDRKYSYRPDCTMQKISDYMISQIKDIEVKFKDVEEKERSLLDLCQTEVNQYNKTYERLKKKLIELQEDYCALNKQMYSDPDNDTNDQKDENNFKYKYFYDHCRTELLLITEETGQLSSAVDYILQLYSTEEELINSDKSILWNSFRYEMVERSKGIKVEQEFDIEKLKKKREKNLKKNDELKNKANKIKMQIAEGMEKHKFDVSKNEIKTVKKMLPNKKDAQKLFLILLGISRKNGNQSTVCIKNQYTYKDGKGKKKKGAFNQNQISMLCKFASDGRKYKKNIKVLQDEGFIKFEPLQSGKAVEVSILENLDECKKERFADINEYADFINLALKK